MSLEINHVSKRFGRFPAVNDVSLHVEDGEFLALLGPSGSGKTTLMRILAGLESADAGGVTFRGEDLLARAVRDRRIGFVFQHYALFRHMTAADNIAFGMKIKRRVDQWPLAEVNKRPAYARPLSRKEIKSRVEELLALVQLEGLGGRYPSQLSGGQRQRVALARALAIEPSILLLDEPFGALDAKVRRGLRRWLRDLHEHTGLTTIFVTHDQDEALELADRIAILRDGRIEQIGTPEQLYREPASGFVFDFLGDTIQLPCVVNGGIALINGFGAPIVGDIPKDGPAIAYMRPDEFDIGAGDGPGIKARVRNVITAGRTARVDCSLDNGAHAELRVPLDQSVQLSPRDHLRLLPRHARAWPAPAGGVRVSEDGAPGSVSQLV